MTRPNWPEWWHILAKPSCWIKILAKRAGADKRKRQAAELFLKDCWRNAQRPSCGQGGEMALPALPRELRWQSGTVRMYACGSLCRACGTEFYTQRRLLLHLKSQSRCCDVLAATGARAHEPQAGITTWKEGVSKPFVLCSPCRVQPASTIPPDPERKLKDAMRTTVKFCDRPLSTNSSCFALHRSVPSCFAQT